MVKNLYNFGNIINTYPQQFNFVGKSEEDDRATIFFIAGNEPKNILNFSLDSLLKL